MGMVCDSLFGRVLGIVTSRTPSLKPALTWSWVRPRGTAMERLKEPNDLSETYHPTNAEEPAKITLTYLFFVKWEKR
jgi:hypothetical protein